MLFKPTLKSVQAKKAKALGIFQQTKTDLMTAIEQFKSVINLNLEARAKLMQKVQDHEVEIDGAQSEIKSAEETISKINSIVGA